MEYCDRGGLRSYIDKGGFKEDGAIKRQWVVSTLCDIAYGMSYLHSVGVLHADLNTNNVLLSSSSNDERGFVAKVADFGMSRKFNRWSRTHKSTGKYGTLTHVPPEMLCDGQLSPSADVYAFGIVMWEMWTGDVPFPNYFHGQLVNAICNGERPSIPADFPPTYREMVERCWNGSKSRRPGWADIIAGLQAFADE